jgi:predicted amidophosphoribosyltransferase
LPCELSALRNGEQPWPQVLGECGAGLQLGCASCGATIEPGTKFCGECGAALTGAAAPDPGAAPPAAQTPVAERRLVSVLFADLVGFTTHLGGARLG